MRINIIKSDECILSKENIKFCQYLMNKGFTLLLNHNNRYSSDFLINFVNEDFIVNTYSNDDDYDLLKETNVNNVLNLNSKNAHKIYELNEKNKTIKDTYSIESTLAPFQNISKVYRICLDKEKYNNFKVIPIIKLNNTHDLSIHSPIEYFVSEESQFSKANEYLLKFFEALGLEPTPIHRVKNSKCIIFDENFKSVSEFKCIVINSKNITFSNYNSESSEDNFLRGLNYFLSYPFGNLNDLILSFRFFVFYIQAEEQSKNISQSKNNNNILKSNSMLEQIKNNNKEAFLIVAKTEAGRIIMNNAIDFLKDKLPESLQGFLDTSLGKLALANLTAILVENYLPLEDENLKSTISETLIQGAMSQVFVDFNIGELANTLLKGVNLKQLQTGFESVE